MQIDKYILELTKLRQRYGPDLEVVRSTDSDLLVKAPLPRMAWKSRTSPRRLFVPGTSPDKDKGEGVIKV